MAHARGAGLHQKTRSYRGSVNHVTERGYWQICAHCSSDILDLPGAGAYAARLICRRRPRPHPVHRPAAARPLARSKVALLSTVTYTVYANFTDLGPGAWKEDSGNTWASGAPHADPTLLRDVYRYIDDNALYGTYDLHRRRVGVVYGSYLRPILNMRPTFRYRIWAAPPRFPADLYLVEWLDHEGIEVDFLTDHDLQAEGAALLEPYAVVVSSSHHEYWSAQMLDGLEAYLGPGWAVHVPRRQQPVRGRVVRPGPGEAAQGGGPALGRAVAVRGGAGRARTTPTTGEQGGTWRNRGRAPNRLVASARARRASTAPCRSSASRTRTTRGSASSSTASRAT